LIGGDERMIADTGCVARRAGQSLIPMRDQQNRGCRVSVIHATTSRVVNTIRVGGFLAGVAVTRHGSSVYVAGLGPGTVTAIDTRTHRVASTVSVGPDGTDPFAVRATADAVYVANQGVSTLSVIDPRTLKTTASIATGTTSDGHA
jgi:YVTN family beta-propeller protein